MIWHKKLNKECQTPKRLWSLICWWHKRLKVFNVVRMHCRLFCLPSHIPAQYSQPHSHTHSRHFFLPKHSPAQYSQPHLHTHSRHFCLPKNIPAQQPHDALTLTADFSVSLGTSQHNTHDHTRIHLLSITIYKHSHISHSSLHCHVKKQTSTMRYEIWDPHSIEGQHYSLLRWKTLHTCVCVCVCVCVEINKGNRWEIK